MKGRHPHPTRQRRQDRHPWAERAARWGLIASAATLAACTSLTLPGAGPAEPPATSPATPADSAVPMLPADAGPALGGQPVALPSVRERLTALARQEWALWGSTRWHLQANTYDRPAGAVPVSEHQAPMTSRVLHYWYSFKSGDFAPTQAQYKDGSLLPWSAAFISFLMKTSGVAADLFRPNESHWTYLRAIIESPNPRGFEALDAAQHAPAEGDLVCAPREADAARQKSFAQLQKLTRKERDQGQPYHCDLVVAVNDSQVEAIGGNVNESVVLTLIGRDSQGVLLPTPDRPWTVLLRNRLR